MRYASGNTTGGGPIYFEIEGRKISPDITVGTTGDWGNWETSRTEGIDLPQGEHVIRLVIEDGGFNIGKLNFISTGVIQDTPPVADAGQDISLSAFTTQTQLDGSGSFDTDSTNLSYTWDQISGPSNANFSNSNAVHPTVSGLQVGRYEFRLTVRDAKNSVSDTVFVTVADATGNNAPTVSVTSPSNGSSFEENDVITITANASDSDGNVSNVEFYDGNTLLGSDTSAPYSINWSGASVGNHTLTARATDDNSESTTSQPIQIEVNNGTTNPDTCSVSGTASQQGSFSTGYTSSFKTVGNDVIATFEILDTDRVGLVAFLWRASPFTEYQMTQVSEKVFSYTIQNQTAGSTIRYACKFAFAGGLAVTEYIEYVVGTPCSGSNTNNPVSGDGLTASYYNGQNFENFVFDRKDDNINFNWNYGSPGNGVGIDNFSVRWSGDIIVENSGTYTFYLTTDNGRRLYIGDQVLIDQWVDNWDIEYQGSIFLEAGRRYAFKLEYFENYGGANAKLEWEGPSTSRAIVPKSVLYSDNIEKNTSARSSITQDIAIYPNPAESRVNVISKEIINRIDIVNLQGQRILSTSNNSIDVGQLPSGYYFMKIALKEGVVTKKFVKK